MAAIDPEKLSYHLVDGVLRHKTSGNKPTSVFYDGKYYTSRQIINALTPKPKIEKPKMTVLEYAGKYYLKSKDGDVHSTRYASRDKAADAARRIAAGLIHFSATTIQINKSNLSNRT